MLFQLFKFRTPTMIRRVRRCSIIYFNYYSNYYYTNIFLPLARRKKTSIKQIFNKYGVNLTISRKIQGTKQETTRTVSFLDLTTLRKPKPPTRQPTNPYDPFRIYEH